MSLHHGAPTRDPYEVMRPSEGALKWFLGVTRTTGETYQKFLERKRKRAWRAANRKKERAIEARRADKKREYMRKYNAKPEVRAKQREHKRQYRARPENKAKLCKYMCAYYAKPENRARLVAYQRAYRARKKQEAMR